MTIELQIFKFVSIYCQSIGLKNALLESMEKRWCEKSVKKSLILSSCQFLTNEKTLENQGFSGGRNRTRTCDPIDVNDVLYQLSHATK